jgi:hypothetical protein
VSYDLANRKPPRVTFDVRTGVEVEFDVEKATCMLDIRSNTYINMAEHNLYQHSGNYSKWVHLNDNQGVAVTGLTSCGAVFLANSDLSRIAAGHMSGDALYAEKWLDALLEGGKIKPSFMVWGTGTSGSRKTGGSILLRYMEALGIPPSRAPAVAGCGAVFLVKSAPTAIVHATRDVSIKVKRSGQAVQREYREPTESERIRTEFDGSVKNYDGPGSVNEFMLIQSLLKITRGQTVGIIFDETEQIKFISEYGKDVLKRYYQTLPFDLKSALLEFEIFKAHPDFLTDIR